MLVFTCGKTRCTLTFGFAAVVCAAFVFGNTAITVGMLACILWHEIGHLLALLLLHAPPRSLKMTVFGLELAADPRTTHLGDALVSLAGPAVNLLAAALLFFTPWKSAAKLNLLLGLFHLLPIDPLDGGQVLQHLLSLRLQQKNVRMICLSVSLCFLFLIAAAGFLLLFQRTPNITLFLLCLYLLFYLVFGSQKT